MKRIGWMACVMLALLGGCKPDRARPARDLADDDRARIAAEATVRAVLPAAKDAQFRGEQVWDQALPGRRAVCGQVSPYPDDAALFVPFVAVMARGGDGRWTGADDARFVATSVADADRTYLAIVAHCYHKGGPADGPLQSVVPLPPAPNQIPRPAPPAAPATATGAAPGLAPGTTTGTTSGVTTGTTPGATPGAVPAGGTVTLRQNANLHATPQGAATRIVPQGTALKVFATAPGGWYQVGDEAPWGWVHESMLAGVGR